jgi:hypothetical protein
VFVTILSLKARPGAYPRVDDLNGERPRLERPGRDKYSSLLRTLVNYGRKKFYQIGSSGLSFKHITNLNEDHHN